jgi:hypothetical protein
MRPVFSKKKGPDSHVALRKPGYLQLRTLHLLHCVDSDADSISNACAPPSSETASLNNYMKMILDLMILTFPFNRSSVSKLVEQYCAHREGVPSARYSGDWRISLNGGSIAQMSCDFLAASVSVARLVLGAPQLYTDARSFLHESTIIHAMYSKQWIKSGLLDIVIPT